MVQSLEEDLFDGLVLHHMLCELIHILYSINHNIFRVNDILNLKLEKKKRFA